jgi:HK97 family phage major capsid protein
MNNLKTLREAKNENGRMARNLVDQNPGRRFTAAKQTEYDGYIASIDRLDTQINAAERERDGLAEDRVQDAIDTAYRERRAPRDELTDTFLRRGMSGFTDEQRRAIRNTMSTTTGSQGGFTVPSNVADRFAGILKYYSAVRDSAEVITATKGNVFGWPISDDSANTAELLAENATSTALDPSFATAPLQTWKYSSKVITVPFELIQDSNLDIEAYVLDRFAARIGRLQNTHFTTGTGTGQPTGFSAAATVGKTGTTGQTLTIIYDDIVDLIGSVDPAYRKKPGAGFMLNDSAWKIIRKLKDTTNARPLFLPSDGVQPETLMGYPVSINPDCASMAANARSVFFGNWNVGYKVLDSMQVTLFRFDDSAYAKLGQVGFLAFARSGGNLIDSTAVKGYVNSAT